MVNVSRVAAQPQQRFVRSRVLHSQKKLIYETTISTIENPAETATRVFEPQLQQERPRNPSQPSPRRPQTPDSRLIAFVTLNTSKRCRVAEQALKRRTGQGVRHRWAQA
jgi:hypothetical protein